MGLVKGSNRFEESKRKLPDCIPLSEVEMKFRSLNGLVVMLAIVIAVASTAFAQKDKPSQTELSATQRMDVMSSKLESMRRSLNSAISAMPATSNDKKQKPSADDPRERLRGLEKEVAAVVSEINDIRTKQDKAERYDTTAIDRLETSVADLSTRVEAGLQATASARSAAGGETAAAASTSKKKKKGKFFGLFGGDDDKYAELTGSVAPGRDRVLFEEAAKQVRKGSHETGRLLFTTIINTYPDSPFLPLAKLAIADSFYLEGTSSSLIQAAQAYQDWLTFFPTDPLADNAMLKVAEAEMRQMGLSDRDVSHARKAEQRLKSLMQQFPKTELRPEVEERLKEVQENLAMHNLYVARFYYDARYQKGRGTGLKGSQSRLKEIVEKYPQFSYMDEVLFRLGTTYQLEEEPDEAAKYYQNLLRDYPNSEYADKAREQLGIIGAPIPDIDPSKKNAARPDRPTFMQNVMQQVTGKADISVNKDGVLIRKDSKEGTDLIDEAIKYNGQLPANLTPSAPTQRSTRPAPAGDKPAQGAAPATSGALPATTTPPPGIKP
jgi:outer membrane protein assembly factor BamD